MNLDSISNLVTILGIKGLGAASVIAILINFFIWYRTGSTHLLLRSLWGRFISGKSTKPKELYKFLNEYTGLLEFRFRTGLKKVRTIAHAKLVIEWTERHDEDIGDVAACRWYFDLEKMSLRDPLPKTWVPIVQMFIAFSFGFLTLMSVVFAVQDSAIIKLNDSDQWLLLGKTRVKPFSGRGFQFAQCQEKSSELSKTSGMSIRDIETICNDKMVKESNLSKFIDDNVQGQRIMFSYFAAIFVSLFLVFYVGSRALTKALEIRDRLRKKSADPVMKEVKEILPPSKTDNKEDVEKIS